MAKKVLLADDEQDIQQVVGFRLRKAGYEVVAALDGKQAVELAVKHKPDLILLDFRMPNMNGKEACILIRKEEALKKVPILVLTASTETISQDSLEEWGANDIFYKPFNPDELLAKISQLLLKK